MGSVRVMLTVYDAPRCPYCARVRIVLAEKHVEYEAVEIDLHDRPAWIYEKNATGRVPVVEEDGWVLPESAVIMEYLEERYPEPPLLAADPGDRALARLWIHRHDDFTRPYYALRRGEDGAGERFDQELARLDAALTVQPWLSGAAYGLADIAYVPWVLRARDTLGVELDAFPALADWLARLLERPAVAAEAQVVAAL
jgi:glutathione S-transferase